LAHVRFRLGNIEAILAELGAARGADEALASRASASFDWRTAGWAVSAASRWLPWRSDCLIQTMAATRWLRRKGYSPSFHLGVVTEESRDGLEAHAWLSLDGEIIVGGDVDTRAFSTFAMGEKGRGGNRGSEFAP
jgi:hypothetical protein